MSGVLANSFVLKTFMKEGVLVSPKNILHINLALSNILVVLGFPFSGLSSWHGKYDLEFFIFNYIVVILSAILQKPDKHIFFLDVKMYLIRVNEMIIS